MKQSRHRGQLHFFYKVGLALAFMAFCLAAPAHADDLNTKTVDETPWQSHRLEIEHQIMARQINLTPAGLSDEDAVKHPLIYWREWTSQRLPCIRIMVVLLLTLLPIKLLCPKVVAAAQDQYEHRWARSMGIGLLFLILGAYSVGLLGRLGLFGPLATVALAAIQLIALIGLCVSANSIGNGASNILHLHKRLGEGKLGNLMPLCLGILLISLLVLIPHFKWLPGLGNRLLALLASAGTGAFLLSVNKRDQKSD